ncbi:hypothetical protein ACFLZ1_03510 [Patescibacteria group bacterium]
MLDNKKRKIINPYYFWLLTKLMTILINCTLFIGGIYILSMRIPVWSLLLGFPATQIGLVALIFTFDATLRKRIGPDSFYMDICSICGKFCISTQKPEEEAICIDCATKQKAKN